MVADQGRFETLLPAYLTESLDAENLAWMNNYLKMNPSLNDQVRVDQFLYTLGRRETQLTSVKKEWDRVSQAIRETTQTTGNIPSAVTNDDLIEKLAKRVSEREVRGTSVHNEWARIQHAIRDDAKIAQPRSAPESLWRRLRTGFANVFRLTKGGVFLSPSASFASVLFMLGLGFTGSQLFTEPTRSGAPIAKIAKPLIIVQIKLGTTEADLMSVFDGCRCRIAASNFREASTSYLVEVNEPAIREEVMNSLSMNPLILNVRDRPASLRIKFRSSARLEEKAEMVKSLNAALTNFEKGYYYLFVTDRTPDQLKAELQNYHAALIEDIKAEEK